LPSWMGSKDSEEATVRPVFHLNTLFCGDWLRVPMCKASETGNPPPQGWESKRSADKSQGMRCT
jgi:hypothetical protein